MKEASKNIDNQNDNNSDFFKTFNFIFRLIILLGAFIVLIQNAPILLFLCILIFLVIFVLNRFLETKIGNKIKIFFLKIYRKIKIIFNKIFGIIGYGIFIVIIVFIFIKFYNNHFYNKDNRRCVNNYEAGAQYSEKISDGILGGADKGCTCQEIADFNLKVFGEIEYDKLEKDFGCKF